MQSGLFEADSWKAQEESALAERACARKLLQYRAELLNALRVCLRLQEEIALLPSVGHSISQTREMARLCAALDKAALALQDCARDYPYKMEQARVQRSNKGQPQ